MHSIFLNALHCRNNSRPPVWLMRQAGRYMASYRALRQKYSFLEMCHQPDLITKVTLLPIEQFGMDAAILFSDILVIPEAMGVGLRFEDSVGPIIERPVQTDQDIEHLPVKPDLFSLRCVEEGIRQLKSSLDVPLIGFCGAPFTVASYMIEGKTSRDFKKTKKWMLSHPQSFHRLLNKVAEWSIAYLKMQIEAGVDAIQIFDSWANTLAHQQFREFSLHYLQMMLQAIGDQVPVILFCRGSSVFAPQLASIGSAAVGLDWNCDIGAMRNILPSSVAVQGNLDPDILYAPKATLQKEVNRILEEMQGEPGFIFNLGHGVFPDVSEEAVHTLVECVKRKSPCLSAVSS
jgi:uroporphyrinogen decarboxylase